MKGSCLCGGVAFEVEAPLRPVIACHCSQCRKQSGHFWAASSVPLAAFRLLRSDTLVWFAASDAAKRGFCNGCGAFLFWAATDSCDISFAAGAIDGPTGLQIAEHWHVADAGDYYHGLATEAEELHGGCLCGANRFTLPGPMGDVWGCHCHQCRKTSGHFSASFDADPATMFWNSRLTHDHIGPKGGKRSFCPTCGTGLTFDGATEFAVEAGCIDNPTGGRMVQHIFVAEKGDYYELNDGLPQSEGF
jgi:hypothetical protein